MKEVSVQTDMQFRQSTETWPMSAAAELASVPRPRPPATRKKDVIPSPTIFKDVDTRVYEVRP